MPNSLGSTTLDAVAADVVLQLRTMRRKLVAGGKTEAEADGILVDALNKFGFDHGAGVPLGEQVAAAVVRRRTKHE